MKRSLLPVILMVLAVVADASAQARPARPGPRVRWVKPYEKAKAAAEKGDAPLFVFVYRTDHAPSKAFARKLLADVTFRKLSKLFVMTTVDGRQEKDLAAKLGVQKYPTLVMLDSAEGKVYSLDATAEPKKVVQYMVRTFLISMHNSGKRLKDAGRVRSAIIKFKWVVALAPGTPPARNSKKLLKRIESDGIKKLSQAAIAKDNKDYLRTMELLDELVYEYRSTSAGRQAVAAMIKLLKEPDIAKAYREVVRRQMADRKLRYAKRLYAAQDVQNALIVYWDVTRDYAKTPAAEAASVTAGKIAESDPALVEKAKAARIIRDCSHWLEMAKAFEMNKRTDKALEYLGRVLKYYPDTSWAEKAKTERKRMLGNKSEK